MESAASVPITVSATSLSVAKSFDSTTASRKRNDLPNSTGIAKQRGQERGREDPFLDTQHCCSPLLTGSLGNKRHLQKRVALGPAHTPKWPGRSRQLLCQTTAARGSITGTKQASDTQQVCSTACSSRTTLLSNCTTTGSDTAAAHSMPQQPSPPPSMQPCPLLHMQLHSRHTAEQS